MNAECQCDFRPRLLISFSGEICSERREPDIFIRTFQSLHFFEDTRDSELCYLLFWSFTRMWFSPLGSLCFVSWNVKNQRLGGLTYLPFNPDIISSTANSAEKCSGLAKAPWWIGNHFLTVYGTHSVVLPRSNHTHSVHTIFFNFYMNRVPRNHQNATDNCCCPERQQWTVITSTLSKTWWVIVFLSRNY